MTIWSDFGSLQEYGRFAMAKEFVHQGDGTNFAYQKNRLERLGEIILKPIFHPTDLFFRNIRNPLVILAMTATAIALVSIAFYPTQFMAGVYTVAPFLKLAEPWMVKFALYVTTQSFILGLGLRTLGRQNNEALMTALRARGLAAIPLGSIR